MFKFKDTIPVLVIALLIVISFWTGYATGTHNEENYHYRVMQAQWDMEAKRLKYAYDHTDTCASDDCLETWSELLGEDNLKSK